MKKLLLTLGLTASLSLLGAGNLSKNTFENMQIFKDIGAEVSNFGQVGNTGMYMVMGSDKKKNPFKVVVDSKGEFLFLIQSVINTKTKSEFKLPIDTSILEGKETFTYGTGKEVIYVFTDPECPYCKKFEKVWPTLTDKYTFKVFLFNLSFHKKAVPMSNYIISGGSKETRGDRLIEIANGNDTNWLAFNSKIEKEARKEFETQLQDKNLNKQLKKSIEKIIKEKIATELKEATELMKTATELGGQLGVQGTPTTIKTNGETVVDWSKL